jgi:hypothetical protein
MPCVRGRGVCGEKERCCGEAVEGTPEGEGAAEVEAVVLPRSQPGQRQ